MNHTDPLIASISDPVLAIQHRNPFTPAAIVVWSSAICLTVIGFLLVLLNHLSLRLIVSDMYLSLFLAAVTFSTVGALIVRRHPSHLVGWLCLLAGAGNGLLAFSSQYARYTLVTNPGALTGGKFVFWINLWAWIPIEGLLIIVLPLLFPNGRLVTARWRPFVGLAVAGLLLLGGSIAFQPYDDSFLPQIENPYVMESAESALKAVNVVGLLVTVVAVIGSIAAPIARYRRSRNVERLQLKWFVFGATILILGFVVSAATFLMGMTNDGTFSGIVLALAFPCVPLAAGIAILRHRLYDIDVIINRTLVYGALTVVIVSIYVLVVGYLGSVFRTHGSSNLLISLAATGVVAVIFQPLREWLQRIVNRTMFGDRDQPYRVLARLGEQLETTLAPDEVMSTIVGSVREALKLPYVAIVLPHDGEQPMVVASAGEREPVSLRLPLRYQGQTAGELWLASRGHGDSWSPADLRLLDDLARHAGLAVQGARAMSDLRRSRERLVLAREEERRRLRRDLHDDLAPKLAGLGLTAATITELIRSDPDRAAQLNARLEESIRGTVADIRRLVYDLRPPALDQLGLVEAIRDRAIQFANVEPRQGSPRISIRVEADEPLPQLPAALEVAAFRISQEALMNVVRHSGATDCVIRLACVPPEHLLLEIIDNGAGLPASFTPGVGLSSMRERASELGGQLIVKSSPSDGTTIRATLPLNHLSADNSGHN